MKFFTWIIGGCICMALLFASCYSQKNITYFQDLTDTSKIYSQVIKESYEAHIQPDDVIEIIVNSINPQATAIFNLGNNTPVTAGSATSTNALVTTDVRSTALSGFLVNKDGIIDYPVLGKLVVKGLSISQLKDTLARRLDTFLKNPIVNARLLNYKITVLGEVARPASYILQSERVSVIDAIGMAGDLTIYGKRENVLLVREEGGRRNFVRLNLNSSTIFESPYYYLKQNDVVYVEPNDAKVAGSDPRTTRNITIALSVATLVVLIFSQLRN
ncbi:MAG: polysaccharide biosynthesis/export family protein [Panacibacter sp.]